MSDPHSELREPASGRAEEGMPGTSPEAQSGSSTPRLETDDAPTIISKTMIAGTSGNGSAFSNLLRGRRLAHFELIEPIGVGGMAAVVRARDTQLDRLVALKILPPDMAADPENVKRFENEARAAAKLDHENIARVFYCGSDQGLHFIAFEYVEGQNLSRLIDQHGRIPVAEAVHYVLQIASGLVHAAERGVVHRDVKPSNIIVTETGRAKLVDMGLARNLSHRPGEALTHSGVTLGTFDYISPEQALEPRDADVRSDIYSLGCTLYHMVTGVPPVPEGTAARKLQFHQNEAPLDPRQLNGEIPDELAAILSRMMAKNREERYERPEILVQHLIALARQLQGENAVPASQEVMFVDSILPSPPRVRPLLVLAGGALLLLVLVGVAGPLLTEAPDSGAGPRLRRFTGAIPNTAPSAEAPEPRPAERAAVPVIPAVQGQVQEVTTVAELRVAVEDPRVRNIILDGKVFDLSQGENVGSSVSPTLTFTRCDLTLQGKDGNRPVIRLGVSPVQQSITATPLAAMFVESGIVTLKGLQFEIDAGHDAASLTALQARTGQLIVEDCEFREINRTGIAEPRATVLRVASGGAAISKPPSILFQRCVFHGGHSVVDLENGAALTLDSCLLGSYTQPVALRSRDARGHEHRTSIVVSASAWQVGTGPVFQIDSRQPCSIKLARSVVSRIDPAEGAALFVLDQETVASCRITSERNYFHDFDTLVAARSDDGEEQVLVRNLSDTSRLHGLFTDHESRVDTQWPWEQTEPSRGLAEGDVLGAFRLKSNLPQLRLDRADMLGPRLVLGQELYRNLPPLEAPASPSPQATRELIVDGQGTRPGTYKNLASALSEADAESEAVISVRLNGPTPIRPVDLGTRKVTIRAADGFRPEFTFHQDQVPGNDGDIALFRLHDGELTFEQVGFRLGDLRERDSIKSQSVVMITGSGRCQLKGCLATLVDEAGPRSTLIGLGDPTGAMMGIGGKAPRGGMPAIELEDCFIRGHGDAVGVRVSRPFQLDVRNVAVGLNGSFIAIDGNRPDAVNAESAVINLDRVTAYLTQSLVQLRATPLQPLHVPVRVNSATSCIFVSATGNPLLRVDGPQSEDEMKRRLAWQGRRNFYSPASSLLLWQPLQKEEMPHKYGSDRWSELWGRADDQPVFAMSLRFAGSPLSEKALTDLLPSSLALVSADPPDMDLGSRGAVLDQLPLGSQPAASAP